MTPTFSIGSWAPPQVHVEPSLQVRKSAPRAALQWSSYRSSLIPSTSLSATPARAAFIVGWAKRVCEPSQCRGRPSGTGSRRTITVRVLPDRTTVNAISSPGACRRTNMVQSVVVATGAA